MRELVFAYLATRPEFADPEACRTSLVGPMRRFLAAHDGREFEDWNGLPPQARLLIAERRQAQENLADFCLRCGRCPESRILKSVTPASPGCSCCGGQAYNFSCISQQIK